MGVFDRKPSKKELIGINNRLTKRKRDAEKIAFGLEHELKATKSFFQRDNFLRKARGRVPKGLNTGTMTRNGIFHPIVDPRMLMIAPENNYVLGAVIDKIISECTKDPDLYEWIPRFAAMCLYCGEEYKEAEPEECEKCGSDEFRKADKSQLIFIEKMFRHPNNDKKGRVKKTLKDVIKSLIYYNQTIDDYYLEVSYSFWGNPAEIYPMTSESIRVKGDETETNWFTKNKFCPRCYRKAPQTYKDSDVACKLCDRPLEDTAYIQLEGYTDKVVMRWAEDEVIHDNSRAWGNRIYGFPKVWSVWVLCQILKWIEYYQWSAYSKNEMPDSITVFVDMSQSQVNKMIGEAIAYKKENPEAKKNLWLGSESGQPPVHIKTMPTLVEMATLDMSVHYREAIAIRYGVSLTMLGVQTPSKLGKETETVEVSHDTIVEVQTQINETFNTKLIPLFDTPKITEWEFRLKSPKKDDELRKAQVRNMNAATVVSLRSTNIHAQLDVDTFEPEIIDQPPPPDPSTMGSPMFMSTPREIEYPDGSKALEISGCPPLYFLGNDNKQKMTPRKIPPGEAIAQIRTIEDEFVGELIREYEENVAMIMATKGTRADKLAKVELLSGAMVTKFEDFAKTFYLNAYMKGLMEEVNSFGEDRIARFTQVDQNALEMLVKRKDGILDAITTFGKNEVEKFREIITESYAEPGGLDLNKMVNKMEEATDGGRSNLIRIARSETTRISNTGRATQFKKYADPNKAEYHWIIANHPHGDNRSSDICKAIANGGTVEIWGKKVTLPGNPYPLETLEKITEGFLPHPHCRSTVVRIPEKEEET